MRANVHTVYYKADGVWPWLRVVQRRLYWETKPVRPENAPITFPNTEPGEMFTLGAWFGCSEFNSEYDRRVR